MHTLKPSASLTISFTHNLKSLTNNNLKFQPPDAHICFFLDMALSNEYNVMSHMPTNQVKVVFNCLLHVVQNYFTLRTMIFKQLNVSPQVENLKLKEKVIKVSFFFTLPSHGLFFSKTCICMQEVWFICFHSF